MITNTSNANSNGNGNSQSEAHQSAAGDWRKPSNIGWIRLKGVEAVAYVRPSAGRFEVKAFKGKANKPSFYYLVRTLDAAAKVLTDWRAKLMAADEAKASRRAERRAFEHTLKNGDLLRSTWGYDQTNVDFYEVLSVHGKMVTIREVAQLVEATTDMTGTCVPRAGVYCGKPMRKRVQRGNGVRINSFAWASPYEQMNVGGVKIGEPARWSSYA